MGRGQISHMLRDYTLRDVRKIELRMSHGLLRRKRYADQTQVIPVLLGRRIVPGIAMEAVISLLGGSYKLAFFAICEGEISQIHDWFLGGQAQSEKIAAPYKKYGIFYFPGTIGQTGVDTPQTSVQKRTQKEDPETETGTPYSRLCYAKLRQPTAYETEQVPDISFDMSGALIQKYDSRGLASGSEVFLVNPIWQATLIMLSRRWGMGLRPFDIYWPGTIESADYCDVKVESQEASTTLGTNHTAQTTLTVVSSVGFQRGREVRIQAGAIVRTVVAIPSDTEIEVDSAVTASSGDDVVQWPQRFESHLYLAGASHAAEPIRDLMLSCRGFARQTERRVEFHVERDHVADSLTNGGFETWDSATDPATWTENVSAANSVNEETGASNIYAGTRSARLDRVDSGALQVNQAALTGLVGGSWYVYGGWVKSSAAMASGVALRIENITQGYAMDPDGVTKAPSPAGSQRALIQDTTTSFARAVFAFKVPEDNLLTDSWTVRIYHQASGETDSLYLDAFELVGPLDGDFRDTGHKPGSGIARDSFRWGVESDKQGEVNRVEVDFLNQSSDIGQDRATANDWDHQLTHPVKILGVDAPAVADLDQADRIAQYWLRRARTLGPGCQMRVGTAGLPVQVGGVVAVTHELPGWVQKRMRVIRKETHGLGDDAELSVSLELEEYDASIYTDEGPAASAVPTRPLGTLTLAQDHIGGRQVELSWSWSADTYEVRRYSVHRLEAAGEDPDWSNRVAYTGADSYIYNVQDSEVNTTLYFVIVAYTDRGVIESNELSLLATNTQDHDLDPNSAAFTGEDNMVWGGDFSTPGDWTLEAADTWGDKEFPTTDQAVSGKTAYNNPANAEDDDADFADGDETDSVTSGHEWSGISSGTKSGRLTVQHERDESVGSIAQTVDFSLNGGSSYATTWDTGSATSGLAPATVTENLTSQLMSDVIVRAQTSGGGPSDIGEGRVSRCYFEESATAGTASISSSVLTLKGNSVGVPSRAYRLFPLRIDVARKHMPPDGWYVAAVSLKRENSGQALDAPVLIKVRQQGGGGWEQTFESIPAANVTDNWERHGAVPFQIDASIPVAKLEVVLETASTKGVDLDKLHIRPGKQIPLLFTPAAGERDDGAGGGTVGDFGTGDGSTGGGSGYPGGGDKPGGDPIKV